MDLIMPAYASLVGLAVCLAPCRPEFDPPGGGFVGQRWRTYMCVKKIPSLVCLA